MGSNFLKKPASLFLILFLVNTSSWGVSIKDDFHGLTKRLARGIDRIENKKVGVLLFSYVDGKISSGSSIVAERITTGLVGKRKIQIIERRLLSKLLQEKYLSETGLLESSDVKKIGSILGVEAVVTGTLIDLDNGQTEINARLIRVESGEILSAASAHIARTWNDRPALPELPKKQTPKLKTMTTTNTEEATVEKLKSTKLSNEDFPPERRKYHAKDQPAADTNEPLYGEDYPQINRTDSAPVPKNTPKPLAKPNLIEKRIDEFHRKRF